MAGRYDQTGIVLSSNGFEANLPDEFEVLVRDVPNGGDVREERARVQDYWFVHWTGGKLYYLRLKSGGPNVDGTPKKLRLVQHPWLLRARLEDAVADRFKKYAAIKQRPFTFLAIKTELVALAIKRAGIEPNKLTGVTVTPRFEIHAKIYEPTDGDVKIGVFVTIGMAHDIGAEIKDLMDRNVDLSGRHIVRRKREPGQRSYIGRFDRLDGDEVVLQTGDGAVYPVRAFETV